MVVTNELSSGDETDAKQPQSGDHRNNKPSKGNGNHGNRTTATPGVLNGHKSCGVGGRRSGRCKWFNVVKGFGFITPDDGGQDVFVHQTVIQMPGFRSLGEGEAVEFECRPSEKGIEATFVCGPTGSDCRGSDRRPISRKKFRKIRCYNCGDFANHIAAKCPHGPLPKRCHFCKSSDHLIADCPSRKADREAGNSSSNGEYSDSGRPASGPAGEQPKTSATTGHSTS